MNILLVDDELDQVETLKRGLKRKGYGVVETTKPHQALDLLHNKAGIDLVITDYLMPFMNGIELLENIRKTHPFLPVIIMTAYGQKELLVNALHNSCNGYIEKPFTLEQLTGEIERARATGVRYAVCREVVESIPLLVHQINNPLMAINGTAEMAMCSLEDPMAVKNYMNRILAATKELSKLNQEIMNAAKQTKKGMHPLDIISLTRECLSMFEDLMITNCIQLHTRFPKSPLFVIGYQFDLEQMLKNMILNSIDAILESKVKKINVSIELAEDSSFVAITIEDSGCGIPENAIDRLFESYFTLKSKGTGLGLAVVRKVIEQHSGRIEVASGVGKGTSFKLLLPAPLPEHNRCGACCPQRR